MNEINIDNQLENFKKHLERNPRVIFSSHFGEGKTYFLRHFVKRYQDSIYSITLHPINYSVAPNEDIFEYIKRDILFQLLRDDKIKDIKWKEYLKRYFFTKETLNEILVFIQNTSNILPHSNIDGLLKALSQLKMGSKHILNFIKRNKSKALNYVEEFTKKKGIYEFDAYSVIIKIAIKSIKESSKKTLLIFEDLDRIDPGQFFRILNVLGAHIDECLEDDGSNNEETNNPWGDEDNKFGFTYIITVFDYQTARHVFHHFYGEEADYEGYISKYLSSQPVEYLIKEQAVDQLITKIKRECGNIPIEKFTINEREDIIVEDTNDRNNFSRENISFKSYICKYFSLRNIKKAIDANPCDFLQNEPIGPIGKDGDKIAPDIPFFKFVVYCNLFRIPLRKTLNLVKRELYMEGGKTSQCKIDLILLLLPLAVTSSKDSITINMNDMKTISQQFIFIKDKNHSIYKCEPKESFPNSGSDVKEQNIDLISEIVPEVLANFQYWSRILINNPLEHLMD